MVRRWLHVLWLTVYVVGTTGILSPAPVAAAGGTITDCADAADLDAAVAAGGQWTFDCSGTILVKQTMQVSGTLTLLAGPGKSVILDGQGANQIFNVAPGATLDLTGLTLEHGQATSGGAIGANGATLHLSGDTFSHNSAGQGGAVWASGSTVTVDGGLFSGNAAASLAAAGGAVDASGGTLTASGVTFSGNSVLGQVPKAVTRCLAARQSAASLAVTGKGGALALTGGVTAQVVDSTFANNLGNEETDPDLAEDLQHLNDGWGVCPAGSTLQVTYVVGIAEGGAIAAIGPATAAITGTTFAGNAAGVGGALATEGTAAVTVDASTFAGNLAEPDGWGGSAILALPGVQVEDSTFEGNRSDGVYAGAVVALNDQTAITDSTFADNTSGFAGSDSEPGYGGNAITGDVTLTDSIVAGSHSCGGFDAPQALFTGSLFGFFATALLDQGGGDSLAGSGNLQFGDTSCSAEGAGTWVTGDPRLGPLADNGGPTQTMALLRGSAAAGALSGAGCSAAGGVDQHGAARPASGCDIGAYQTPRLGVLSFGDTSSVGHSVSDWTLAFTATGGIAVGDVVWLAAPSGTLLPAAPSAYSLNGVACSAFAAAPSGDAVALVAPVAVAAGATATVAVGLVINPAAGAYDHSALTVATAADPYPTAPTTEVVFSPVALNGVSFVPSTAVPGGATRWTITFTPSSTLGPSDSVDLRFPDGTVLPSYTASYPLAINGQALTPDASVTPLSFGGRTLDELMISSLGTSLPAGQPAIVTLDGVTNPPAGAYPASSFTASVNFGPDVSPSQAISFGTEVSGVTVAAASAVAGAAATWGIGFQPASPLPASGTVTFTAPPGTVLPSAAGAYSLSGESGIAGVTVGSANVATLTLAGSGLQAGVPATLSIAGVENPPSATYAGNAASVVTSADTLPASPAADLVFGTAMSPGDLISITPSVPLDAGQLAAGGTDWLQVQAIDGAASLAVHQNVGLPGALIYLSLSAGGGGTATVDGVPLTAAPQAFRAGPVGILVAYAPGAGASGSDVLTAGDTASTPGVVATASYAHAATAVGAVRVQASPPLAAGQSDWTVAFTATSGLKATTIQGGTPTTSPAGTIMVAGPAGTDFPLAASAYTLADATQGWSSQLPVAPLVEAGGATVSFPAPLAVGPGDALALTVTGVRNPPAAQPAASAVWTTADAHAALSNSVTFTPGVAVTPSTLPPGTVGEAYRQTLLAQNGTAPYTWSIYSGTLPAGLSLDSVAGTVYGTPTASGTSSFVVQVTDSGNPQQTGLQPLSLSVDAAGRGLSLFTTSLPPAAVGSPYNAALTAVGGTPPYAWSLPSGALPAGLGLDAVTGAVYGTPITAGTAFFTIHVTDSGSPAQAADGALSLSVAPAGGYLAVTTASMPGATAGTPYNASLIATGGTAPYTWSLVSGSLPAGLTLSAVTGAVYGTPAQLGLATFTVQVRDAASPPAAVQVTFGLLVAASGVTVTGTSTGSSSSPSTPATAGGAGSGTPDTTASAAGGIGTVTTAQYAVSPEPHAAASFQAAGIYFDVAIASGSTFDALTLTECGVQQGDGLYWWTGTAWASVSPGPTYSAGCLSVTLGTQTSPTVVQLQGTPFAVASGASGASGASVPAPEVLAVAGAAGGVIQTMDGLLKVTVPAGALPPGGNLAVFEATTPAPPPGAVSPVFVLSGTAPASPVAAAVAYQGSAAVSMFERQPDGSWRFLPTAATGGVARFRLPGLGAYALAASSSAFPDVSGSYWAGPAIGMLAAAGLVSGEPDGGFHPEDALTRAQFTKLLAVTLGLPTTGGGSEFRDVPTSAWYARYVSAAAAVGLVQGVGPGVFAPDAPVSREMLAVLVARAEQLPGGPAPSFSDAGGIDGWAAAGVAAAVQSGYMRGFPDGAFRPRDPVTRAQAAQVLAAVIASLA